MFSSEIKIFKACKDSLEAELDSSNTNPAENVNINFHAYLNKDENGTFIINDNTFSIRCIFEENFIQNFLSAKENIQLENLYSKQYYLKSSFALKHR